MIEAKVIADSISGEGKRLTTFQLLYPRFIHSELMTHRVFSRNASSSRAIPVKRMLEMVRSGPAKPVHWGKNQPGMQAREELEQPHKIRVQSLWQEAAEAAAAIAEKMAEEDAHKQIVNRILEPFQHISVVLTATEFDNWFELRAHEDAQPEIYVLAKQMRLRMSRSQPKLLQPGEWHLPYVTEADYDSVARYRKEAMGMTDVEAWDDDEITKMLRQVSAARCCRVSYLKHDGTASSVDEDLALCDRLVGARPLHASPFEHQATPDIIVPGSRMEMARWEKPYLHGNLVGWIQHRKLVERQFWS